MAVEALCKFWETCHNENIGAIKNVTAVATGIAIFIWVAVLGIELVELWSRLIAA